MTEEEIQVIFNNVSIPRISTYTHLGFEEGSEELIEAYFSIQEISSHFFVPIQILEICLRNSISSSLSKRFSPSVTGVEREWYELLPFSETSRAMVATAKKNAEEKFGEDFTEDDLISRLMFGFWVYCLEPIHADNKKNPYHFWQYEIDNIFPGRKGNNLATMFQGLRNINTKRNRLYHHEPIWKKKRANSFNKAVRSLKREYYVVNDALGWTSPVKKRYMESLGYVDRFEECCRKHLGE